MNLNEPSNIGLFSHFNSTFLQVQTHFCLLFRVSNDRNNEKNATVASNNIDPNLFQGVSPEKATSASATDDNLEYNRSSSIARALMKDKSALREEFQRIKIAGDFQDMSHIEDLEDAVGPLLRAMVIREKSAIDFCSIKRSISCSFRYMIFSLQSFPRTVARFLNKTLEEEDQSRRASSTIRVPTGWNSSQLLSPSSSSPSLNTSVVTREIALCQLVFFAF